MDAVLEQPTTSALRLRDLDPAKSPSFSPNLYRWMRAEGHFFRDGGTLVGVYSVRAGSRAAAQFGAGTLLIGYPTNDGDGDADFIGVRLMSALCKGAGAGAWCYLGLAAGLDLVPDFWGRYVQVGRCAIDPEHKEHFSGGGRDRFIETGNTRTCQWCGAVQHRTRTPRTVVDETWG